MKFNLKQARADIPDLYELEEEAEYETKYLYLSKKELESLKTLLEVFLKTL